MSTAGMPRTRSIREISAAACRSSSDDAVDLENLGELAVHVDAVHAREVVDVLRVRVAPVMLGGVLLQGRDLQGDVLLLERDVPLVLEVEVVPRNLVAEDGRPLEGAQAFLCDRAVVLVDVVEARLEDDVRLPLFPERDEQLEDVLPPFGESADVEVVHGERLGGNPELGRRLGDFPRERVGREARRERAGRDREGDVADVATGLDEAGHRPAAPELAVVGVRSEDERLLPLLGHRAIISGTGSPGSTRAGARALTRNGETSPTRPISTHVVGSSKKSLYASEWTKIASSASPAASATRPYVACPIRR